jgi:hypothetical protein
VNTSFKEGKLRFDFSGVRIVRRWDKSAAYENGLRKLSTAGAVDFCAILQAQDAPVVLEVTDYRGYRLGGKGSKHALSSGQLIEETATKVRDSIAGMLWACARSLDTANDPRIELVTQHLVNRQDGPPRLLVVFWLEEDSLQPMEASTIAQQVERRLRPWLRPKVIVTNKRLEKASSTPLPWLTVT